MTREAERILVVKLAGLASFVQALPAMKALRAAHRSAHILLLTDPALEGLAADVPYIDEVDSIGNLDDPAGLAKAAQRLKGYKFARVYDLDRSERSERVFNAMKPFPPVWSGSARGAKFRFNPSPSLHPCDVGLQQLVHAGLDIGSGSGFPDASWATTARHAAPSLKPAFFGLSAPFVLVAPVVQRDGDPPHWPTARFAGLAARLIARGVAVAIVTEPADKGAGRAIIQACPDAKDLGQRADLTQVAALACEASGAFGHYDTGVLHLAAAAGARTISIAPSHEEAGKNGPRGEGIVTLAAPDPATLTVEYAASTLAMFAGIGALKTQSAAGA